MQGCEVRVKMGMLFAQVYFLSCVFPVLPLSVIQLEVKEEEKE